MKVRIAAAICSLALAGGAAAALSAHSDQQASARPEGASQVAVNAVDGQVGTFDMSQVKSYKTISELAPETEAAVEFTAGASAIEMVADLPFTVTSATVTDSFDNSVAPGTVIKIRQTGQVDRLEPSNGPQLIEPGGKYVAALGKFHFQQGDETGQWVIVGDGLWLDRGNGKLTLDAEASPLPPTTTVAVVEGALGDG